MAEKIKIRKGFDIKLKGEAEKIFVKAEIAELFGVKPTDFHGLIPKLTIKVGDIVKAGSVLFYDKYRPDIKFTSPVSGVVQTINRGERRRILEVIVKADELIKFENFKADQPTELSRERITKKILESGLWPSVIQRPYNVIANPEDTPKSIFISAFDTAPLAPDYDFLVKGLENEFQIGIDALAKLTEGKIHLSVDCQYPASSVFSEAQGVQINKFKGPHPTGNVGTQIHKIDPINKGDIVWTIKPQDVIAIGRLFLTGHYDASRIVALTGSEVAKPKYYKTISGSCIRSITNENIEEGNVRYISGNVLTGTRVTKNGFLGYYDSQITVIPEGDHYEFIGWMLPGLKKFSASRSFMTWMFPKKEYTIDSNLKGGKRALMITGSFEKVFPMDIYPMQLLKAIIIEDIDLMEKLGIYEVAEEDFALCEFVDTSKTDIQDIVRNGLDLMKKEMH